MIDAFYRKNKLNNVISYQTFFDGISNKVESGVNNNSADDKLKKIVLNYHRILRIHKTYRISDDVYKVIESICEPQFWVVITEDWCGDSAQSLPYIARMAEVNKNISLHIIPRDDNTFFMDNYLTEGKRAIPKLIAFDEQGEELFLWGPRPKPAADLFRDNKVNGINKEENLRQVHLWYARDKGKSLETEFKELLQSLINIAV